LLRSPTLDIVRVQDTGMRGADDPALLQWCAEQGRVLVTHDVSTITAFAYDRVRRGLPMPGVVEVNQAVPIGAAIDDLLLLAECGREGEFEGQVVYLPL
jgi:hypothetical protein